MPIAQNIAAPPSSRRSSSRQRSARGWAALGLVAAVAGIGIHLILRPPALAVPLLEHPELLDPQVRHHLDGLLAGLQSHLRDPQARATFGIALAANGLWKAARQAFLDTARQSPREALAYLYAAVALQEMSDTSGAFQEFRSVTVRFPSFAQGWYRVAEMSLRAGNLSEAEDAFQQLTRLAPTEWRGPAGLGEIRIHQGRAAEAVPLLEHATALDRTAKPALYLLGQAYRAVGRTNEARIAIAAGAGEARQPMPDPWGDTAPNHVRALPDLLLQADRLSDAGRPDLAVRLLRQALPFHPVHAGLLNQYAVALNRSGQPALALPILDQLLRQNSHAVAPRITRVYSHDLLGQASAGLEDAHEAIRQAPQIAQAHLALADALLASEQDREAVAALEQALKCDPGNAEIHVELGQILWRNLGNPAAALSQFEVAIELNPALTQAYALLANLQIEFGNLDAARRAAAILRQLSPDSHERIELDRRIAHP